MAETSPGQTLPLDRDPTLDTDPLDRDPRTETPMDRDPPWTETPWTETLPGQRPSHWSETPLDRDTLSLVMHAWTETASVDRQTPVKTLPCPKLHLRVVIIEQGNNANTK